MADNTIILQGRFVGDGTAETIQLRSGVDWMEVYNFTQSEEQNDAGVYFYWQRGMEQDTGLMTRKTGGGDDVEIVALADGGFTFVDSSDQQPGALQTVDSVSNATPPLVTVTSTAGLVDGDVVRMIDITGGQQLGGIDFTIDVQSGTTFQLEYMAPIAAATTGFYRKIDFDPIYYPRHRYITEIVAGQTTEIRLSVTHGYTVGQEVRVSNPDPANGMPEINGLSGEVLAVDLVNNTITVDIDSSGFTAFAFPLTADVPFTPALVVPVGQAATEPFSNELDDATRNEAFLGMRLAAGADSPAGAADDVIYWKAGVSFSVDND